MLRLEGGELTLGRETLAARAQDARISRCHARVFQRDGRLQVQDLGSLNGTSVDGRLLPFQGEAPLMRCLRLGDTLFVVAEDVRLIELHALTVRGERVIGPRLAAAYMGIARFARSSPVLHVTGESGVGKEDAARAFHAATTKGTGPFIPVNCAAVPESLAERLLFGAKRGAFSGATEDVPGFLQAAHGGTLFLDEVAELHSAVQAKLLRVLESREVQTLGAVRTTPVDLRVCSASHTPLRAHVASGRLREDLYYRIARPEVIIPPLRTRLEEIPALIQTELGRLDDAPRVHSSFVEACLLRHWPGNLRELRIEVRAAAQEAVADASPRIEAKHLSATAGCVIIANSSAPHAAPTPGQANGPTTPRTDAQAPPPTPEENSAEHDLQPAAVQETLLRTGGNVAKTARALGIHRSTLRRFLTRHQIDPARLPGVIAANQKTSRAKGSES